MYTPPLRKKKTNPFVCRFRIFPYQLSLPGYRSSQLPALASSLISFHPAWLSLPSALILRLPLLLTAQITEMLDSS
ncbi:hypothetical protein XELAEV_18039455mg [Xenopus laevis]|uniref:Uncharacterized protein n=1 Tax=Xenopus laevis TaxID=8355 RepID=A0A974C7M9_XENLA|nr:hypothetical protein XELAEV_18039455mg [Xenopus laevis]